MYNPCWAYAERILSHTEHTRNEFLRILSIRGTDFIACWACAEMFKSRISWPNRKRFSKISCYRPLGPFGFCFYKKSQKKISCLCTFNNQFYLITNILEVGRLKGSRRKLRRFWLEIWHPLTNFAKAPSYLSSKSSGEGTGWSLNREKEDREMKKTHTDICLSRI